MKQKEKNRCSGSHQLETKPTRQNMSQYLPKLDLVRASQKSTDSPLCQFTTVIFQLSGQDGSPLIIQLRPPINATRVLKYK
jgi:hypothetical protein